MARQITYQLCLLGSNAGHPCLGADCPSPYFCKRMTIKRYRKVLARLALSASLLISVGSAEALAQTSSTGQTNGLTASELLRGGAGRVQVPSQAALFPRVSYTVAPKVVQTPPVDYSRQRRRVAPVITERAVIEPIAVEPAGNETLRTERAIAPRRLETTQAETTQRRAAVPLAIPTIEPTRNRFAQLTDNQIRDQLIIEANVVPETASKRPRPIPASSFLTPTAYGADWGDAYIGLSQVTAGRPASSNFDGSAAIGIGFGDAVKNVGLEVSN